MTISGAPSGDNQTPEHDRAGRVAAGDDGRTPTLMWEARAADGRLEELLEHVLTHADAAATVYRSADDRVVVIDPSGRGLADVPAELVARPPHAWPFEAVPR